MSDQDFPPEKVEAVYAAYRAANDRLHAVEPSSHRAIVGAFCKALREGGYVVTAVPNPKHRPELMDDDLPTGFCECGLRYGHDREGTDR